MLATSFVSLVLFACVKSFHDVQHQTLATTKYTSLVGRLAFLNILCCGYLSAFPCQYYKRQVLIDSFLSSQFLVWIISVIAEMSWLFQVELVYERFILKLWVDKSQSHCGVRKSHMQGAAFALLITIIIAEVVSFCFLLSGNVLFKIFVMLLWCVAFLTIAFSSVVIYSAVWAHPGGSSIRKFTFLSFLSGIFAAVFCLFFVLFKCRMRGVHLEINFFSSLSSAVMERHPTTSWLEWDSWLETYVALACLELSSICFAFTPRLEEIKQPCDTSAIDMTGIDLPRLSYG